jgi:uncharacterized protein (TIGR00645 family)
MYLGLVVVLLMLLVVFAREVIRTVPLALEMSTGGAIVAALTLIDLVLVANLLLIVMLSGFESFVQAPPEDERSAGPDWIGGVDFAGLKIKLVASIVAISGIELLKRFMAIGDGRTVTLADPVLLWSAAIHLVFVLSAVLLAVTDRLSGGKRGA